MCGRYSLIRVVRIRDVLPDIDLGSAEWAPRYNIAPGQEIAVTTNRPGRHRLERLRWGLIPSWAKDPAIANRMINARAETLAEKPAFRTALQRRRCLVWADGFYEWQRQPGGGKVPMYIRRRDQRPFAFAGLWDRWRDPAGGEVDTCTIITTAPNELMAPIHDRMPVILSPDALALWLKPEALEPAVVAPLLRPCPAEPLEAYPVSRRVNTPANEGESFIAPAPAEDGAPAIVHRKRRKHPPGGTGSLFGDTPNSK